MVIGWPFGVTIWVDVYPVLGCFWLLWVSVRQTQKTASFQQDKACYCYAMLWAVTLQLRIDMVGVVGSNPIAPTNLIKGLPAGEKAVRKLAGDLPKLRVVGVIVL